MTPELKKMILSALGLFTFGFGVFFLLFVVYSQYAARQCNTRIDQMLLNGYSFGTNPPLTVGLGYPDGTMAEATPSATPESTPSSTPSSTPTKVVKRASTVTPSPVQ